MTTFQSPLRDITTQALAERFRLPALEAEHIFDLVQSHMSTALRRQFRYPEGRNEFWTLFHRYRTNARANHPLTLAAEDIRAMNLVDHLLAGDASFLVAEVEEACALDELKALGVVFFTAPIFIAYLKQRMDEVGLAQTMLPFLLPPSDDKPAIASFERPVRVTWPFGKVGPFHC